MQHAFFGVGRAFFVAHRPHEDAGMVAVAADEIFKLAQAFGIRRHHARLVEDQHAQLVAGVEQLRRGRIVRGAQAVAAHLLQLAHAVVLHRVGQRRAQAGVVLVIAGAFHLDRLAVEEQAFLRVELDGADAEARLVAIDNVAAGAHFGHQRVEIALFERPELRLADGHLLLVGLIAPAAMAADGRDGLADRSCPWDREPWKPRARWRLAWPSLLTSVRIESVAGPAPAAI